MTSTAHPQQPSAPTRHGPDFVAPDGSIQVTRADYPGAQIDGVWQPGRDTLTVDDITAVRGVTRVDPPVDEDWIVVTFAVRNRWGDDVQQIRQVNLGGRVFALDPLALDQPLAAGGTATSPEAPSPAPREPRAASEGKSVAEESADAGKDTPA